MFSSNWCNIWAMEMQHFHCFIISIIEGASSSEVLLVSQNHNFLSAVLMETDLLNISRSLVGRRKKTIVKVLLFDYYLDLEIIQRHSWYQRRVSYILSTFSRQLLTLQKILNKLSGEDDFRQVQQYLICLVAVVSIVTLQLHNLQYQLRQEKYHTI